jgi:hypothetical protein
VPSLLWTRTPYRKTNLLSPSGRVVSPMLVDFAGACVTVAFL